MPHSHTLTNQIGLLKIYQYVFLFIYFLPIYNNFDPFTKQQLSSPILSIYCKLKNLKGFCIQSDALDRYPFTIRSYVRRDKVTVQGIIPKVNPPKVR